MRRKSSRLPSFIHFLANHTGVSVRTIERWCADGKVPGAYRTRGGHWRLRKPRGKYWIKDRIAEAVAIYTLPPARPLPPPTEHERLEWRFSDLQRRFATQCEKLATSPEFNNALEFSMTAVGISDDDWRDISHPDPVERRRRIMALKDREPEKWAFIFERPFFQVHPLAQKAIREKTGMLLVKAEKLRLNQRPVTPSSLAHELKISVATLYRRYSRAAVKRACQPRPVRDEVRSETRFQINGL